MATAFAQTAPGGGPPAVYNIGFILVLVGIFYFLLLRPEQKRRKEHDELLSGLKRNDQIVTSAGIHGRVTGLADKTLTIEIAPKVQVTIDRSAVQQRAEKAAGGESREKERAKS